jgi:hypothetical protein
LKKRKLQQTVTRGFPASLSPCRERVRELLDAVAVDANNTSNTDFFVDIK